MFTFGIFSTHLPYIAFVLFYGFFFLVGIEKASAGDLGEGQQIIPEVISVSVDVLPDVDDIEVHKCNFFTGEPDFEQLLLYEIKKNLYSIQNTSLKRWDYRFLRFSRPPPVA